MVKQQLRQTNKLATFAILKKQKIKNKLATNCGHIKKFGKKIMNTKCKKIVRKWKLTHQNRVDTLTLVIINSATAGKVSKTV